MPPAKKFWAALDLAARLQVLDPPLVDSDFANFIYVYCATAARLSAYARLYRVNRMHIF